MKTISFISIMFFTVLGLKSFAQSSVSVFKELIQKIDDNLLCPSMNYTLVTVRQNPNRPHKDYSYTSFGKAKISLKRGNRGIVGETRDGDQNGFITGFSDRDFFQGNKDLTKVEFSLTGNSIIGSSHLITWGVKPQIENVKVFKKPFGYFITGEINASNSSSILTIAIYNEFDCLH